MTIEFARRFILKYPEALHKGHPKHQVWLEAQEEVDQFRRQSLEALMKPPGSAKVLSNPRYGRMVR